MQRGGKAFRKLSTSQLITARLCNGQHVKRRSFPCWLTTYPPPREECGLFVSLHTESKLCEASNEQLPYCNLTSTASKASPNPSRSRLLQRQPLDYHQWPSTITNHLIKPVFNASPFPWESPLLDFFTPLSFIQNGVPLLRQKTNPVIQWMPKGQSGATY